jgi:tartrate-resistant acid phosphatase type 5
MMAKRTRVILFGAFLFLAPMSRASQDGQVPPSKPPRVALSVTLLDRLEPGYFREEVQRVVYITDEVQAGWLKLSDEDLKASVVGAMGLGPEDPDLLLYALQSDRSEKLRVGILSDMSRATWRSYWRSHPDAQKLIEQVAMSDSSPRVELAALNLLRSVRIRELDELLDNFVIAAKRTGDSGATAQLKSGDTELESLAETQALWRKLDSQVILPGFLQVPPPVFSVTDASRSVRVLAFGDFGTGSDAQKQLAAAMLQYQKKARFDFGVTLGDNFYPTGVSSPDDPQWRSKWEEMYGPLRITFYPTFGNHDYLQPDSAAAEILYSQKSPDWRFPAAYYTFTAGPAQFFAIDTTELTQAELQWLDEEIRKSKARWKIVYGHHPIFSATGGEQYLETGGEGKKLLEELLPLLKGRVDLYLSGHHHNLQELKTVAGVHFFVSGGGGAQLYNLKSYDRSIFKEKVNGFTVLEADASHFKISFISTNGTELYESTFTKP